MPIKTFQVLRALIRFIPKLPAQAAFSLYNYIIGYIMFYVRHPKEKGQELIGQAMATLWMVVHSVQGIMFKDLKQILRKEQVDAAILITANVPSAKKIIVHGPQTDEGGIPSQFPLSEDVQFCQILQEALDFFGIDEEDGKEHFLVDHRTRKRLKKEKSFILLSPILFSFFRHHPQSAALRQGLLLLQTLSIPAAGSGPQKARPSL